MSNHYKCFYKSTDGIVSIEWRKVKRFNALRDYLNWRYPASFKRMLEENGINKGGVRKPHLDAYIETFSPSERYCSVAKLADFDSTGDYREWLTEYMRNFHDGETSSKDETSSKSVDDKMAAAGSEKSEAATTTKPPAKGDGLDQLRDMLGVGSVDPEMVKKFVREEMDKLKVHKIQVTNAEGKTWSNGDKPVHKTFKRLLEVTACRQTDGFAPNTWVPGPTGSGKSHAARDIAAALDLPFYAADASTMPHEVVGFVDANGVYNPTAVTLAFREENGAVLLLDECDAYSNEALLKLNAILANGSFRLPDGTVVKRHKNLIVLAGANTFGLGPDADFVGRARLDAAFLSRFPVVVEWDYDEDLEIQISGNASWAREVQKARQAARDSGLKVVIDTRHSIAGAALLANGMAIEAVREITYMARMTDDQRSIIKRAVR